MEHIKKYWWAYGLLIVAAVVLYMNWTKWFGSSNEKPKVNFDGETGTGRIKLGNNTGTLPTTSAEMERQIGGRCQSTRPDGTICYGISKIGKDGTSYCDCGGVYDSPKLSAPSTYCMPKKLGTTCPERICYNHGKWQTNPVNCQAGSIWYVIDFSKSTSTQCCYKKL